MQSVSSRVWTRVAVSISKDDNHDTTGTSKTSGYDTKLYRMVRLESSSVVNYPFIDITSRSRVVAPDRILSMDQIELSNYNHCRLVKLFNYVQTNDWY